MSDRPMKVPGPDHPITLSPEPARVVVRMAGQVVADTRRAIRLKEAAYPAVMYIPREDADMALLERTGHVTWCPYKGECNYFSIPSGGDKGRNAVWTYEHPFEAVAAIRDHLAFYPNRVDAIEHLPA